MTEAPGVGPARGPTGKAVPAVGPPPSRPSGPAAEPAPRGRLVNPA